jgi:hypothetical protein
VRSVPRQTLCRLRIPLGSQAEAQKPRPRARVAAPAAVLLTPPAAGSTSFAWPVLIQADLRAAAQKVQRTRPGLRWLARVHAGAGRLPLVALAATFVLVACTIPIRPPRPGTIVDPEASGVVASISPIVDSSSTVTVEGRQVEIDLEGRKVVRLYSGAHLSGVLLYGTNPRPWYVGTSPPDDGCYLVGADQAFDDRDAVILVFTGLSGVGIRVPKAPDFVPGGVSDYGPSKGQYITFGGPTFCLDAQGRMTRSTGAPPPSIASP